MLEARAIKVKIQSLLSSCSCSWWHNVVVWGWGWGDTYISHVKGAENIWEFILPEYVRKGFTEEVILDEFWRISRSLNGRLGGTGASGMTKEDVSGRGKGKVDQKAKRNTRPWGLRTSPGDGCVRKCPHRAYTLGFILGSIYSFLQGFSLRGQSGIICICIHTHIYISQYKYLWCSKAAESPIWQV